MTDTPTPDSPFQRRKCGSCLLRRKVASFPNGGEGGKPRLSWHCFDCIADMAFVGRVQIVSYASPRCSIRGPARPDTTGAQLAGSTAAPV